jgi:hypothetical protein
VGALVGRPPAVARGRAPAAAVGPLPTRVGLEVERAELVQAHDHIRVAGLGVLGAVHQGVQVQDAVLLRLIVRVAGPLPGLQSLKGDTRLAEQLA